MKTLYNRLTDSQKRELTIMGKEQPKLMESLKKYLKTNYTAFNIELYVVDMMIYFNLIKDKSFYAIYGYLNMLH
jgi:KaiC/GvpD/RAD55 family RecA-like ATPase